MRRKPRKKLPVDRRQETPAESTGQLLWLGFAVLVAGAPHMLFVHPWVPVLVILLSGWRLIASTKRWALPRTLIRAPLTIFGFIAVLVSYRQISGLDAGSALLLVMVGMKLLETRGYRDRSVVIFICYFLLFTAFLREQAIWSAIYLLTGVVVTTAALIQNTRQGTIVNAPRAMTMASGMVLQAIPLMIVLFLVFPRIPGPFWALPKSSGSGMTGLSDTMTPGDITELALSDAVAFRVRFDDTPPPAEDLYWRGPVLNSFDGRTWLRQEYTPASEVVMIPPIDEPRYRYELTLEPHGRRWLLALETPIEWSAKQAYISPTYQLVSAIAVNQRMSYRGSSFPGGVVEADPGNQLLAAATRLPRNRNRQTVALANELHSSSASDLEYLNKILSRFRQEEFYYSLTPESLAAESVDDFLFNTKEGFCGHFASAFAVLARAAGIPARVVTGYQGAELNPLGNYWIVRQADAHAWVEAWLDNRWVRFDPTAAVAPERIEMGLANAMDRSVGGVRLRTSSLFNRVILSLDAINASWNRWVLSFGPRNQISLLSFAGIDAPSSRHLVIATAFAITIFLVLVGLYQRHWPMPQTDALYKAYQRLCARTGQAVRPRRPSEGPTEYADTLRGLRPDLGPQLDHLFHMYLQLRYGGQTDDRHLETFISEVKAFRPTRIRMAAGPESTKKARR